MLEYVAAHTCPITDGDTLIKRGDVFHTERFFSVPFPDGEKREGWSLSIDFVKKTITVYAYNISGHNGDHYACITFNPKWDHLLTGYEPLKAEVRNIAVVEAQMAEQKAKMQKHEKLANDTLEIVLKGSQSEWPNKHSLL